MLSKLKIKQIITKIHISPTALVKPVILEKLLLTTLSSTPADIKLSCKLAKYLIRDNRILEIVAWVKVFNFKKVIFNRR